MEVPDLPSKIKKLFVIFVNMFNQESRFERVSRSSSGSGGKSFILLGLVLHRMRLRQYIVSVTAGIGLLFAFSAFSSAQVVVDRTIATVSDGVKTELITRSDLLWQLALQPGVPLDPVSNDDLKRALQLQIDQRIFLLEAQRLPRTSPSEKEVSDRIAELLKYFPSSTDFERRLRSVGFESIKDDNFEALIAQRIAVEKYLDFRFRSFVVITGEDEVKYYREEWVPEFKRKNPSAIVPAINEVRDQLISEITEVRVSRNMDTFLDEAKRRVTITILFDIP